MDDLSTIKLLERFSQIEDPRDHRAKRHSLRDIIVIAICAVLSRSESWVGVEEYGKAKLDFFERLLDLPNGIPSHDTFGRRLDPERFQRGFSEWAAETAELLEGEAVAIDGKTLRRSRDKANGNNAIHMVSAWAGRSSDSRTAQGGRTLERNNGDPRTAGRSRHVGLHGDDRRDGMPEGSGRQDSGEGSRLRAGAQTQSAAVARRGRRHVF